MVICDCKGYGGCSCFITIKLLGVFISFKGLNEVNAINEFASKLSHKKTFFFSTVYPTMIGQFFNPVIFRLLRK